MLDHVGIPVSDFERSKRFYEQALSPLGYELIMEPRYGAAGLGRSGKPDFWVFQGESGHAVHVAFVADDRARVEAFHEAAIAACRSPSTISATTKTHKATRSTQRTGLYSGKRTKVRRSYPDEPSLFTRLRGRTILRPSR
jgi:catechol 2,3-dioxygenase-like lactoylglutathione lyase family enzyme